MSRLQIVWTVTSKELLDFVRDWRTLAAMLLVPLILFPIIFVAVPMFLQGEAEELGEYSVSVQLLIEEDEYNPNELIQLLNSTLVIVQYSNITFDENKSLSDHERLCEMKLHCLLEMENLMPFCYSVMEKVTLQKIGNM